LNVILDVLVGLVPIIGDFLDNLFKSNLRNLALLETWLLTAPAAKRYHILLMPDGDFMPRQSKRSGFTSWFGSGQPSAENLAREKEIRTGKVRVTRRMAKEEGGVVISEPLD
jgi:hypothetical protein